MKALTWSMRACGTPSRPGEDTPLLAFHVFAACGLFDFPNKRFSLEGPACSSADLRLSSDSMLDTRPSW